ncbi:MAG: hypothetical protein QOK29_2784, partial [Rhodospirillaceae bacterium]|nr:hypothetical protein [Rhodospirillaceae bacterium]
MVPMALSTTLPACAGERFDSTSADRPYFDPPPQRALNPTDHQRLQTYRNQLQQQQQGLQMRQDRGTIGQ